MANSIYQISIIVSATILTSACSNGFESSGLSSPKESASQNSSTFSPMNSDEATKKSIIDIYIKNTGRAPTEDQLNAALIMLKLNYTLTQIEQQVVAAQKEYLKFKPIVDKVYADILNRVPEQDGLDVWVVELQKGLTVYALRTTVANSDEAKSSIQSLYMGVLGRAATPAELSMEIQKLINNSSLAQLQTSLQSAASAIADANDAAEKIVHNSYTTILRRDVESSSALSYWAEKIKTGLTESRLRAIVAKSSEGLGLLDGIYKKHFGRAPSTGEMTVDIANLISGYSMDRVESYVDGASATDPVSKFLKNLFQKGLNRTIDTAGFVFFAKILRDNNSLANCLYVRSAVLTSSEFNNRGLSSSDFVETLYQTVFNRASDSGGKQFWLGQLSNGLSRSQVVSEFNSSAEGKMLCQISLGVQ